MIKQTQLQYGIFTFPNIFYLMLKRRDRQYRKYQNTDPQNSSKPSNFCTTLITTTTE